MTIYKVIVGDKEQIAHTSPYLADFESAREYLVTELLNTAEEDWNVSVEDIESIVSKAEVLTENNFDQVFYIGEYLHFIIKDLTTIGESIRLYDVTKQTKEKI